MSQFYSPFFLGNINPSQEGESWVNKCQMSVFYSPFFFLYVQTALFPKIEVPPNHPFVHRLFHGFQPSILGMGQTHQLPDPSRDPGRFFGRAEGRRPAAVARVWGWGICFGKHKGKFMGLFSKQRFEDGILFGRIFGKKIFDD